MRYRIMTIIALSIMLPRLTQAQGVKNGCDRSCLENYVDRYMDAMLKKDPSVTLFSRDCKFTENGVRLPLGNEGLWLRMSGKGNYKFYIPDVETQQVAFLGTASEKGSGTQAGVRWWPLPFA